jgi:hypothetical protein
MRQSRPNDESAAETGTWMGKRVLALWDVMAATMTVGL